MIFRRAYISVCFCYTFFFSLYHNLISYFPLAIKGYFPLDSCSFSNSCCHLSGDQYHFKFTVYIYFLSKYSTHILFTFEHFDISFYHSIAIFLPRWSTLLCKIYDRLLVFTLCFPVNAAKDFN